MEGYYDIPISKFMFKLWLAIGSMITALTLGMLFLVLIIPLYYYLDLKYRKYYYNDEKMIIETGIFNKTQKIVPLYRIINITAQDNIFNFGRIYIKDKEQTVVLTYVKNAKNEMLLINEKWEKAKTNNIRNEVI